MDTESSSTSEANPIERRKNRRRAVMHWSIGIVLGTLFVGSGMVGWHKTKDRFVPRNLGEVVPGVVYRSGQIDQRLIADFLEDRGIRRIVVMSNYEFDDPDHVAQREASEALGIEVIRVAMRGNGVGTAEQYAEVVAWVHDSAQQNIPTLLHCHAGAQRTGGTVAAYRLLVQGWAPAEVYDEARAHEWDPDEDRAWPEFLNGNMASIAAGLVERGAIEAVPDPLPRFGPG
ncbi:MAG: hypothetical protein AAF593_01695 [Planctomycetota bacterium]